MNRVTRHCTDYVAASIGAFMIAGTIYVGVLLLNQAPPPSDMAIIEGAIRVSQFHDAPTTPELRQSNTEEPKPPKELPKTFSNKTKSHRNVPPMQVSMPTFSAENLPGVRGDFSIPKGDFGSFGFTMDEVDNIPTVTRTVPPQYPYAAKRNKIQGNVVVRMLVTAKGVPENMSIHSSTPPGVFDKAALNAAKRWRFNPGKYKGQAVDTWVLLPFNFELT